MNQIFALYYIQWNTNPDFNFLGLSFHWYGILFGLNFIQGYLLLQYFLKKEKRPSSWSDYALVAMLIGTILGARLGHVFFYNWSYYKNNLFDILMIWKGGLASHGAVIGIIAALWIYSKLITRKSILYIIDRLMIPIAIGCFLVRTGNLINQEIIGFPTNVSWGFVFSKVDKIPRHPSQLYEGLTYLLISAILFIIYRKSKGFINNGIFTGIFFTLAFFARFLIEFTKENQSEFEAGMFLNMGQLLSIPFFVFGIILLVISLKNSASRKRLIV